MVSGANLIEMHEDAANYHISRVIVKTVKNLGGVFTGIAIRQSSCRSYAKACVPQPFNGFRTPKLNGRSNTPAAPGEEPRVVCNFRNAFGVVKTALDFL
jgi:hypothetical protein